MITSHFRKQTDCSHKPPTANLRGIFQHHRNFQKHDTFADHIQREKLYKAIGTLSSAKLLQQISFQSHSAVSLQDKALSWPAWPCLLCTC